VSRDRDIVAPRWWHAGGPLAALLAALVLAGCGSAPQVEEPGPIVVPVPQTAAPNGAIYQAASAVHLFENTTARRVGDLLTIRLNERTQASKSAATSTSKESSVTLPGPTIAGRPVTVNGVEILNNALNGQRDFNGEGDSSQSNALKGEVTATVMQRLPNGNLLVRGQKWLQLNQGRELVQIEGIVRAIDIEPDNSIQSWKVGNARITYSGQGAIADANRAGWLTRFFNSGWWPL